MDTTPVREKPTTKRPRTRKAPLTIEQRAAHILVERRITMLATGELRVQAHDGASGYRVSVTPMSCCCPCFTQHPEQPCKHVAAARILLDALGHTPAATCRRCAATVRKVDPTGLCGDCCKAELFGVEAA